MMGIVAMGAMGSIKAALCQLLANPVLWVVLVVVFLLKVVMAIKKGIRRG